MTRTSEWWEEMGRVPHHACQTPPSPPTPPNSSPRRYSELVSRILAWALKLTESTHDYNTLMLSLRILVAVAEVRGGAALGGGGWR